MYTTSSLEWFNQQDLDNLPDSTPSLSTLALPSDIKSHFTYSHMPAPGPQEPTLESPPSRQSSIFSNNSQCSPKSLSGLLDINSPLQSEMQQHSLSSSSIHPSSILYVLSTIGNVLYSATNVGQFLGHSIPQGTFFFNYIHPEDSDRQVFLATLKRCNFLTILDSWQLFLSRLQSPSP